MAYALSTYQLCVGLILIGISNRVWLTPLNGIWTLIGNSSLDKDLRSISQDSFATMVYHRNMLNNFLAYKYIIDKIIDLYMQRNPSQLQMINLTQFNYKQKLNFKGIRYPLQQFLSENDVSRYEYWLRSNKFDNRTGKQRRFLDETADVLDNKNDGLDSINVTGYAFFQSPSYTLNSTLSSVPRPPVVSKYGVIPFGKKFNGYNRRMYGEAEVVARGHTQYTQSASPHNQGFADFSNKDISIKDITDIALTTLSFLSFGMFILQVLTCITMGSSDVANVIYTNSATKNTFIEKDEIEEIRRKRRSIKAQNLKELEHVVQRSLQSLQPLFNANEAKKHDCYIFQFCEISEILKCFKMEHLFWIQIWSSGITWIKKHREMGSANKRL